MLIAHAAWAPTEAGESSELFFWAEVEDETAAWRPSTLAAATRLHPRGAPPSTLRDALARLGFEGAVVSGTATLTLPSGRVEVPAPVSGSGGGAGTSTALAEDDLAPLPGRRASGAEAGRPRPVERQPWRVGGLRTPLSAAVPWLAGLGAAEPSAGSADPALGADLRYWARAAAMALDLLRDEQVVPALDRRPDGDLQAVWRPILSGQSERRRFRALAEAMPPACRVALAGSEGAPPEELLGDFLRAAVDGLARVWLVEAVWPEARWLGREGIGVPGSVGRWLEALTATRPTAARLSARRAGDLAASAAAWVEPILGLGPPFRLCLRLSPPGGGAAGPPARAGGAPHHPAADWRLEYLLQAVDDPNVLAPAAEVWPIERAVARLAGRRVVEPQELLLTDLARAARHVPAIAASLTGPRPIGADLSVDEAYHFLREAVAPLSEAGIGVLAPSWWTRRETRRRLGVRVSLSPAASVAGVAGGAVGMQSLVEYDWRLALGDEELTLEEFDQLVRLKAPLVQLRGEWVELDPAALEQALRFWQGRAPGAMPLAEAARLAAGVEATGLPIEKLRAEGWLADVLAGDRQLAEPPEPPGFVGRLRPYQRRGFAWLTFMRQHRLGACLADDMGLGKTVQMTAVLLDARARGEEGPVLIVCPASVLGNWQRELARFGPELRVTVHHGPARADRAAFPEMARAHDVVLTTYALLHRDEARLGEVAWAGLVLDEAQNVKNAAARTSRAARRLRAGYRVALTGTPVENRLGELWAIMEVLNPGFLGSAESFRRRFALPIERDHDAERAEELRRLVGPLILRRLKTDPTVIRDLPEKIELKDYPPLTREQASLYEAVVQDMLARIRESEGVERRGLILSALTKLKQICNHPAHYLGDGSDLAERSGKLMRLEEMLEQAIAQGDHTLVFTQFAAWGGRLQAHLGQRLGREVLYLHGGTPVPERDRLVQRFQAEGGPPVFVLSLRAGGVGLNLTRANRVVHYDRWWNPAVEAQATDRAFRIGQTRNVQVHAFVCAGTLEERIDQLIESKRALAEAVIGGGEGWLTELSTEDLRSVIELRQPVIVDA